MSNTEHSLYAFEQRFLESTEKSGAILFLFRFVSFQLQVIKKVDDLQR